MKQPRRAHSVGLTFGVAYWALMAGLGFTVLPDTAEARARVPAPVFKAVRHYWRTPSERVKAFDVIACETGNRYNTTARNGQYLGLFQMGDYARSAYGHGWTAMAQARAAYRYYRVAGWSPWSCA